MKTSHRQPPRSVALRKKKPHGRTLTDSSPMRISELASYMGLGVSSIYRDVTLGYVFEFAARRLTTPSHYKAWLRVQPVPAKQNQEDLARQRRVQDHLCLAAGKSHAPLSSRGSRTPSPPLAKSSAIAQPA